MMLNAEFYNFTQQVQGALYAALFAGQSKRSEPLPALPPLMQVRGGYADAEVDQVRRLLERLHQGAQMLTK